MLPYYFEKQTIMKVEKNYQLRFQDLKIFIENVCEFLIFLKHNTDCGFT